MLSWSGNKDAFRAAHKSSVSNLGLRILSTAISLKMSRYVDSAQAAISVAESAIVGVSLILLESVRTIRSHVPPPPAVIAIHPDRAMGNIFSTPVSPCIDGEYAFPYVRALSEISTIARDRSASAATQTVTVPLLREPILQRVSLTVRAPNF